MRRSDARWSTSALPRTDGRQRSGRRGERRFEFLRLANRVEVGRPLASGFARQVLPSRGSRRAMVRVRPLYASPIASIATSEVSGSRACRAASGWRLSPRETIIAIERPTYRLRPSPDLQQLRLLTSSASRCWIWFEPAVRQAEVLGTFGNRPPWHSWQRLAIRLGGASQIIALLRHAGDCRALRASVSPRAGSRRRAAPFRGRLACARCSRACFRASAPRSTSSRP